MPTVIDGQPSSEEVRRRLAETGEPVLLAFSGGKDSVAAWLALREYDIPVHPMFMYSIPGLSFVEESMDEFEDFFETEILRVPHPWFFINLNAGLFQTPDSMQIIERAQLPELSLNDLNDLCLEEWQLPRTTWRADGVRAADSIARRQAFKKHGSMKPRTRRVSPVWDWYKGETIEYIAKSGAPWPNKEYKTFGRSWDGIDYRFLAPCREVFPDDYARILSWFPLAYLGLFRQEIIEDHNRRHPELFDVHRHTNQKGDRDGRVSVRDLKTRNR